MYMHCTCLLEYHVCTCTRNDFSFNVIDNNFITGPITNTIVDFWRMVWEHKLDTIVMLTKCREGGKVCRLL